MKKRLFGYLAKINKFLLPGFSKKGLDMAKAKKWQLAIIELILVPRKPF